MGIPTRYYLLVVSLAACARPARRPSLPAPATLLHCYQIVSGEWRFIAGADTLPAGGSFQAIPAEVRLGTSPARTKLLQVGEVVPEVGRRAVWRLLGTDTLAITLLPAYATVVVESIEIVAHMVGDSLTGNARYYSDSGWGPTAWIAGHRIPCGGT